MTSTSGAETTGPITSSPRRTPIRMTPPRDSSSAMSASLFRDFFTIIANITLSQQGWLIVKKHPEVKRRGATLDLSDLLQDPIVRFQQKYYVPLVALLWGLVPTYVPVLLWGEDPVTAFFVAVIFRYVLALNVTWCVNSWSHMFGYRAYDTRQGAVESSMRHLLLGEGFHNYHHSFPWDYSASELGPVDVFNPCTSLIDFFHYMGWAWDLKKVRPEMINAKKLKTGDPAYYHKRRTRLFEWSTGLLSTLSPLFFGLGINLWLKHRAALY